MTLRGVHLSILCVLVLGSGCTTLDQSSARQPSQRSPDGGTNPVPPAKGVRADAPVFQAAAAGSPLPAPLQAQADDLMQELERDDRARQATARQTVETARRLMNELKFLDAEGKLQEALRLDPANDEARRLLDQVHFVLGDRSGALRDFTREELDREKARRQQAKVELERLYADGLRRMEAQDFEGAVKVFDQVLERIEWFHFNQDLSDLRAKARGSKDTATRRASEKQDQMRREQERAAQQQALDEQTRSLRFAQNRIQNMTQQAELAFRNRDYVQATSLYQEILDLDPSRADIRRELKRAKEMRHLHRVHEIELRTAREWERTFLSQYQGEIPYQRIFNFPSEEHWNTIALKSVSVEERVIGTETSIDADIKARLETQHLTIEFRDIPLEEVIDTLQSISGLNFVLTKEARDALESASPVRLAEVKDLPLRNILRLVLEGQEPRFGYVLKSGAIVIGPTDSLSEDTYLEFYEVSDIVRDRPDFKAPKLALDEEEGGSGGGGAAGLLDFGDDDQDAGKTTLDTDQLVELLEGTLWGEDADKGESESIATQGGKLVARTTLDNHRKIQRLLDTLRKQTGIMVTVESRFVNLQDNFLEEIGVDWGNPFSSNLPNPINDIDGSGTQISPGYEYVDAQGQFDARAAVYNAFSLPLGSSVAPFEISSRGGIGVQYNVLDVYILEAIIEASQKTQQVRELSAPRVTAFNTQIAHSLVIDQSAYVKDAEVNQTGVIPVINPVIGILNAGSILEIRPTVSYDRKYIILEIQPTLAVPLPSRFKNLSLGLTNLTVELPVLSVTRIKTTVTIPDGGTVLVGGLKRTITQDQRVGIPGISRLPFLDILFGRKGNARLQSNLFVLINGKITVIRDEERKQFN